MEWSGEQFFDNADSYFDSLITSMEQAQFSIDFEVYIFEKATIGDRLLKTLNKAHQKGVSIRLLVDGVGSIGFLNSYGSSIKDIRTKVYHPVPWRRWTARNTRISTGWFPATYFQLFASINSRNHRKVCIIDKNKAYLSSCNVSDVHLSKVNGTYAWKDFGVCVMGECVQLLRFGFEKAWFNSLRTNLKITQLQTSIRLKKFYRYFMLNHSLTTRLHSRRRMLNKIISAQKRVWLVTPYFVPTLRLVYHLKKSAEQGVDVRLLLPKNNDIIFMHWVMSVYYGELLASGVKISEYTPSFLHAKAAIIDDWCTVGSMNLNSRSILHDLEANYILQTPQEIKKVEGSVQDIFANSDIIESSSPRSRFERYLGYLLLLFKYWI